MGTRHMARFTELILKPSMRSEFRKREQLIKKEMIESNFVSVSHGADVVNFLTVIFERNLTALKLTEDTVHYFGANRSIGFLTKMNRKLTEVLIKSSLQHVHSIIETADIVHDVNATTTILNLARFLESVNFVELLKCQGAEWKQFLSVDLQSLR